jgi:16S rRNA G966 N2-methylase RsmD
VGFEALSRGVRELVMVEYNRDCQLAIKKNIDMLKANACSLYPQEAERALARLAKEGKRFDIIFFDPPYYIGNTFKVMQGLERDSSATPNLKGKVGMPLTAAKNTLQTLGACDILAPNGFVIAQHFKRDELPEESGKLVLVKEAKYGDTLLSIYRKK